METASEASARPQPGGRPALSRRTLIHEVLIVFAISLGASGVKALLDLVQDLTRHVALNHQQTVLNAPVTPDRPWLDLTFQLFFIGTGVVPVLLVVYLLHRSGGTTRELGFDRTHPVRDVGVGILLASCVGGAGLGLYFGAHALGANLTVVPTSLGPVWWRIPVLLLDAAQNGLLEEMLVVGYLLTRLSQLGWGENRSLVVSALLRGSYHLYQGFGGFIGNVAMGLIFGRVYQRTGRVLPLVIAHFIMDAFTFIGYAELAGHVSWLPT